MRVGTDACDGLPAGFGYVYGPPADVRNVRGGTEILVRQSHSAGGGGSTSPLVGGAVEDQHDEGQLLARWGSG